jgi:hypothetical protein
MDIYSADWFQLQLRREISVDDVLALIAAKDNIVVQEISDILHLDHLVIRLIIEFLIRFDFVKAKGQRITLNDSCRPFFDEIMAR